MDFVDLWTLNTGQLNISLVGFPRHAWKVKVSPEPKSRPKVFYDPRTTFESFVSSSSSFFVLLAVSFFLSRLSHFSSPARLGLSGSLKNKKKSSLLTLFGVVRQSATPELHLTISSWGHSLDLFFFCAARVFIYPLFDALFDLSRL